MTTIAYRNGIIAYDSRMTAFNIIVNDNFEKSFRQDGKALVYCGDVGDMQHFVECVFNNKNPDRELDCQAFVITSGVLHCVDVVEDNGTFRIREIPLETDNYYAIGSGTRFALAYMDCGMSAVEAVSKTFTRDPFSGGKIRTINIK